MYIKKIVGLIAILVAIGMGVFSFYIYQMLLAPNTNFEEDQVYVYIKTGSNFQDVYQQISPFLKNPENFETVAVQKKYAYNIRPGKFMIQKDMNNNDLVSVLRSHNIPVAVMFNNQDRIDLLAGRISNQIEADSAELVKVIQDTAFLNQNGFNKDNLLNMYIPNKYEFFWNTPAGKFRERMLKEYQSFWNETRLEKAEKIGLTPHQVQNLAAIVQKETAKVDERPRVAGVYMNRILNNWKLEADPTVIYALKNKDGIYDTTTIKRVLYKDLEIESPYNTYRNEGIPPGPIAMSDISSIDAVLNYEKHDYYFFVADPKNPGYHKFAKTYAQHNRNKAEYVNWISKMKITR